MAQRVGFASRISPTRPGVLVAAAYHIAQSLLLLNPPQVATQNGTAYVSGICHSIDAANRPSARASP